MLFMAQCGEITPMPDAAIFADTGEEPEDVYTWLSWLQSQKWSFPIYVRSKGKLGDECLRLSMSKKSGNIYAHTLIPTFIKKPDGSRGTLPRKCTRDYKINVIQRSIRTEVLGVLRVPFRSPVLVTSWIGISIDEADRMKPSRLSWINNRWPLIEMGISRENCLDWMKDHGLPNPPRSACKQCPYHSDFEWLRLKTEHPEDFQSAVIWERDFQNTTEQQTGSARTNGVPYLHSSLVPLDKVVFNTTQGKQAFSNECEGMCGV